MPNFKRFTCISLLYFFSANAIAQIPLTLKFYKTVAISKVYSHAPNGAENQKILISEYRARTPKEIDELSDPTHPASTYVLGKPIWEIDQNLPLAESDCDAANAGLCTESMRKLYQGSCFKPCIAYGPEFLDFDEKLGMIYFVAPSASLGNAGGPYFVFAGNINKQKVEFLQSKVGPFKGVISPGGEYLALYSGGLIEIYDMKKHESFRAVDSHNSKERKTQHKNVNVHWINKNQLGYQDVLEYKNFKHVKGYVYDVAMRERVSG